MTLTVKTLFLLAVLLRYRTTPIATLPPPWDFDFLGEQYFAAETGKLEQRTRDELSGSRELAGLSLRIAAPVTRLHHLHLRSTTPPSESLPGRLLELKDRFKLDQSRLSISHRDSA